MSASGIVLLAECRAGRLTRASLETLGASRELSQAVPGRRVAVLVGAELTAAAAELASRGTDEVQCFEDVALTHGTTEVHVRALAGVVQECAPMLVLLPDSAYGRDVAARVSARLAAGLATGCLRFAAVAPDGLEADRAVFGGRFVERVSWRGTPCMATLRAGSYDVPAADPSRPASVTRRQVDTAARARVVSVHSDVAAGVGRPDVEEARAIVAAGRGLGSAANLRLVEQLADALGAAVGASRAVVDLGWLDHQHQIGQTGRAVAPELYVACGIHGAIQHLAGIGSARTIVAIDRDREAPIFSVADYGIVGDVEQVLPSLVEALAPVAPERGQTQA